LLFTHSEDYYCIDLVAAHLRQQGFIPIRVNTDRFPQDYKVVMSLTDGGFSLKSGRHTITESNLAGSWIRKVLFPAPDKDIPEPFRYQVAEENNEILRCFLQRVSQKTALDAYRHIAEGENKLWQLELAAAAGLDLPNGVLANERQPLQDLMNNRSQKYITKLLRPVSWSMQGGNGFFYTSFVNRRSFTKAHLEAHPLLVQAFVPKQYELRVAYVNGLFYAGKIQVAEEEADWRKPGKAASWEVYRLPAVLKRKLHQFMKKMPLRFGALDLIRSTDGKYYFLEVNPIGEWGMLEKNLSLPISKAIADCLIKLASKNG
jgi:glutathione synthase/RimK-type ligase-like ATP-grasp enzyme